MPSRAFIDSDLPHQQYKVGEDIVLMPSRAFIDSDPFSACGEGGGELYSLNALTGIY